MTTNAPTVDEAVEVNDVERAAAEPPADGPSSLAPRGTEQVAALAAERDGYLDALQRVQADFENFRKRARREQEAEFSRAVAWTVDRLLPVLDAFDAARAHHPEALAAIDGVLHSALVTLGVDRIEPLGETFDADSHDAVAVDEPEDDIAAATVVEVFRAGYRCRGQLIRPAMVRVGHSSAEANPSPERAEAEG